MWGFPYAPTWSLRKVSDTIQMTFISITNVASLLRICYHAPCPQGSG